MKQAKDKEKTKKRQKSLDVKKSLLPMPSKSDFTWQSDLLRQDARKPGLVTHGSPSASRDGVGGNNAQPDFFFFKETQSCSNVEK